MIPGAFELTGGGLAVSASPQPASHRRRRTPAYANQDQCQSDQYRMSHCANRFKKLDRGLWLMSGVITAVR